MLAGLGVADVEAFSNGFLFNSNISKKLFRPGVSLFGHEAVMVEQVVPTLECEIVICWIYEIVECPDVVIK